MAILNFRCNDCDKLTVCKWFDVLKKFSEDHVKTPIEVEIEFKQCPEFKSA